MDSPPCRADRVKFPAQHRRYMGKTITKMVGVSVGRERLILLLLAELGLSQDDICRVGPATVGLRAGVFHSLDGDIPVRDISPAAWAELEPFIAAHRSLTMCRSTIYNTVRRVAERANVRATAADLARYGRENRVNKLYLMRWDELRAAQMDGSKGPPDGCVRNELP